MEAGEDAGASRRNSRLLVHSLSKRKVGGGAGLGSSLPPSRGASSTPGPSAHLPALPSELLTALPPQKRSSKLKKVASVEEADEDLDPQGSQNRGSGPAPQTPR